MACQEPSSTCFSESNIEEQGVNYQEIYQNLTQQVTALPSVDVGSTGGRLYCYNGWYGFPNGIVGSMLAQKYFEARPTDVLVATFPKSGTTWIKALVFAIVNRSSDVVDYRQFLESHNPHECIPFLEFEIYTNSGQQVPPDLSKLPEPRLFSTHLPFKSLPTSVIDSGCRVVYLSRDPKDNFVSLWHFVNKMRENANMEPQPLEKTFDYFCKGFAVHGPYWEHVLGYWKLHLEMPQQVLFIKYEELKEEPVAQLKRLAEFLGCPFSEGEEKEGMIDGIVWLCVIENLSNLEVNKLGRMRIDFRTMENSSFFRRGVVGDWQNHLTPEMVDRLEQITEQKFQGSGLTY